MTVGDGYNGSQFFITSKAIPQLDGNNVVFGHIVEGFNVLQLMECQAVMGGMGDGRFLAPMIIRKCGEMPSNYIPPPENQSRPNTLEEEMTWEEAFENYGKLNM
jgi:cyclophilin family peptidyl-prolyl cis-trans isomerase